MYIRTGLKHSTSIFGRNCHFGKFSHMKFTHRRNLPNEVNLSVSRIFHQKKSHPRILQRVYSTNSNNCSHANNASNDKPMTIIYEENAGKWTNPKITIQVVTASSTLVLAICSAIALYLSYRKDERLDEKEEKLEESQKKVDEEREQNKSFIACAKELGLVNVAGYASRTPVRQAKEFAEAKTELYIIGISGKRIVDGQHKTLNPIPAEIEKLLHKGVKIRLMIYNPDTPSLTTNEEKVKINTITLPAAKELKDKYPNFKIRFLTVSPPFHGDLIDQAKAHIIPIKREGIHATRNAQIETYEEGGQKIDIIRADFHTIWKEAEKIKDERFLKESKNQSKGS